MCPSAMEETGKTVVTSSHVGPKPSLSCHPRASPTAKPEFVYARGRWCILGDVCNEMQEYEIEDAG